MEIQPGQPAVLTHSDEASVVDDDKTIHSAFQQNRRFLMLSMPHNFDWEAGMTETLLQVIREAMEVPKRGDFDAERRREAALQGMRNAD